MYTIVLFAVRWSVLTFFVAAIVVTKIAGQPSIVSPVDSARVFGGNCSEREPVQNWACDFNIPDSCFGWCTVNVDKCATACPPPVASIISGGQNKIKIKDGPACPQVNRDSCNSNGIGYCNCDPNAPIPTTCGIRPQINDGNCAGT